MNPHFIIIEVINRCNAWLEEIQCRHTYCLLSVINYTNGLIIATWLFGSFGLVLDLIYCSASCMFGIAITGLYLNHPILMLPDGVHKIVMTLCALFYSLHETDIGAESAEFRLVLVIIAVFLQFAENYVLFQLLSAKHQQSDQGAHSSPPPTYDQLWVVEVCQQSRSCPVTKTVMSKEVNEEARPETPPPCYELAVMALSTSQSQNR
nr:Protein C17G10.7 [Haemonchus contortus]